jgi:hypothetical protein
VQNQHHSSLRSYRLRKPITFDAFSRTYSKQMVLKRLFNGIGLVRVVGLASHLNPELARIADHYEQERKAAARPIQNDIALAQGVPR